MWADAFIEYLCMCKSLTNAEGNELYAFVNLKEAAEYTFTNPLTLASLCKGDTCDIPYDVTISWQDNDQ